MTQEIHPSSLVPNKEITLASGRLPATVKFNAEVVPGLTPEDWPAISSPNRHPLPSVEAYSRLSLEQRVSAENEAVREYLKIKSPSYKAELERIAAASRPMDPRCRLELVAPAYNEHDSIGATLEAVARASSDLSSRFGRDTWGMTIVVNRPVTADPAREERESRQLWDTVRVIEAFQAQHPDIRLSYVVLECPQKIANVGLARAVGHDLTAVRSSLRAEGTREAPLYIQTIDADTTHLNPDFFSIILGKLDADGYTKDFYRARDEFSREVVREYPLAHVIDFMWNDTISKLSMLTDQAWTVGRCTTVSVLAHCSAGGVYPFKFVGGVDEDIRVGTTIRLMRGTGNVSGQGEIEEPLLESDATRALMGMTEVLTALENGALSHEGGMLTRDLHEAARLLKYYRNFHELSLFNTEQYRQNDSSWLETPESFEKAMPILAIEAVANSYRQLAIDGLFQQNLRLTSDNARKIFSDFSEGRAPYAIMIDRMTTWAVGVLQQPQHPEHPFVRAALELANSEASRIMESVLRARGIDCYIDRNEDLSLSDSADANGRIPRPVRVTSAEGLRASLAARLGN